MSWVSVKIFYKKQGCNYRMNDLDLGNANGYLDDRSYSHLIMDIIKVAKIV